MVRLHEESQTKAMRLSEAWGKKRATASEKVVTSRVPAWFEVVDGRTVLILHRSDLVRRIFRETTAGDGRRTVVKCLNAEKIPAFQAKNRWQTSYIAELMSKRAVIGEFQALRRYESGLRVAESEAVKG